MATTFAPKTISPKQAAFIASLIGTRSAPLGLVGRFTEDMTSADASDLIGKLTKCPWKNDKPQVKKGEPVGEGFYCQGEDYYKVQTSKSSGKRYAKVWNGKGWDYASGAVFKLSASDKLTEEQAAKFGKKTGHCCICSKLLTDPKSVSAGIGPVCASKMGW
jgi:hypothetical protein